MPVMPAHSIHAEHEHGPVETGALAPQERWALRRADAMSSGRVDAILRGRFGELLRSRRELIEENASLRARADYAKGRYDELLDMHNRMRQELKMHRVAERKLANTMREHENSVYAIIFNASTRIGKVVGSISTTTTAAILLGTIYLYERGALNINYILAAILGVGILSGMGLGARIQEGLLKRNMKTSDAKMRWRAILGRISSLYKSDEPMDEDAIQWSHDQDLTPVRNQLDDGAVYAEEEAEPDGVASFTPL